MYEQGVVMFKFAMRNFNVWHMLHMCMPKSVQCDRKGFHDKHNIGCCPLHYVPEDIWGPMNT